MQHQPRTDFFMPKNIPVQTVTLTIPLDVFDRIFDIMGSRHKVDPDTEYVLSSLQSAYEKKQSPSGEQISSFTSKPHAKAQELQRLNI